MFESSAISAVIFDLDGTLVETEHLKAEAYAELIGEITGRDSPEPVAIELYRSIVGATDYVVCNAMIERFKLGDLLQAAPDESLVQALHRRRMAVYRDHFGTPANLANLVYSHNIELAKTAAAEGLAVGVATMSFASEAGRVLDAIGLSEILQQVVGVDDVANPKPAPDAFLLVMHRLGVTPEQSLIIEDSPRGAQAAAASGARWLCVATEFSADALRADDVLDPTWIVWKPSGLTEAVARRVQNQGC